MFHFLQPILLWAGAGMIVPVLIHLWNVREGKTLKVGSIALLTENASSRARSFKVTDLLLLLLRCLLLLILSMLLAKPTWQTPVNGKEKGWILIEKNGIKQAYKKYRPLIDTLIKQGYAVHYFDTSFAGVDLQKALPEKEDSNTIADLSYWTLLKKLDEKKENALPVCLFTDQQLQRFQGDRPLLSFPVKWYTYESADTSSSWLEKAYKTNEDSIRLVLGKGSVSGINFSYQNTSLSAFNNRYKTEVDNGKTFIITNDSLKKTELDTASANIAIYTNQYSEDAAYVKAAINAIKNFTHLNINVNVVTDIKVIPENYSWLFWLSDEKMPESLIKNNVLCYENGKVQSSNSFFAVNNMSMSDKDKIPVFKRIVNDSASLQTVWQDGFGNPLLEVRKSNAHIYHFYSHFNPQWNNLVWNPAFPQLIYELIFQKDQPDANLAAHDKRLIDASQMQPLFIKNDKATLQNHADNKDLSHWFWLAAFVLFLLERILSFYTKKQSV